MRNHFASKNQGLWSQPGVGNLRPAWSFDMARIKIFVTQFKVQDRIKTKLHGKQYWDSKPEASVPQDRHPS